MARSQSSRSPARASARDRILTTAAELFYQEGTQNVGIDRIISESGVAKMSLYNHFKGKDALIAAWLEERNTRSCQWLQSTVEGLATEPRDRLLAIFDALATWFEQPNFRGCAFINTMAELADASHPATQVAVAHKRAIADYILSLVTAAEVPEPEILTQQLLILFEGAIVVATMQQNPAAAWQAKQVAAALITNA